MSLMKPYLVTPGSLIRALPLPTGDVTNPPDRGDTVTTLLSGRQAVQRRATARRAWNIPYDYLQARDADILNAFYLGMYGEGPFRFVDPDAVNMLPADVSVCGARTSAPIGWSGLSSSTIARSTDVLPPTDAPASGVLKVHHVATASAGLLFDASLAAPLLPDEPTTVSVYVYSPTVGNVTINCRLRALNGTLLSTVPATQAATVGGWRRFAVTRTAGGSGVFVSFDVTSSVPDLYLAAGQLEYAPTASDWRIGGGVPSVLVNAPPGRTVTKLGYSSHVFQVAE
jgi:hypothetical protein